MKLFVVRYGNTINYCILILYLATWLNSFFNFLKILQRFFNTLSYRLQGQLVLLFLFGCLSFFLA